MELFFALIFTLLVAWFLIAPHLRGADVALYRADGPSSSKADQRERSEQLLRDLELDFAIGNVGQKEYEQTKLLLLKDVTDSKDSEGSDV